ncbi:4374_t:CDS:2 [Funneliformis geosporum]|nr:4374_t:CDS:2 [Funneliformis geosporum]
MDIDSTSTNANDKETYSSFTKDTTNDSMYASSSSSHNNNNDVLHPITNQVIINKGNGICAKQSSCY